MTARRRQLAQVRRPATTHPGLWLDRFLEHQTGDPTHTADTPGKAAVDGAKARLIDEVATVGVPVGYPEGFERWRRAIEDDPLVSTAMARATGRFVIGLGQKGAAEVGIHLDHTWGVPVLPGSALKGLASTSAHRLLEGDEWRKGGASHIALFGTTDEQGAVHFLDAWWVPSGLAPKSVSTGARLPLHADVMTSHHTQYYGTGDAPPSDTDSPNPVHFLSASGSYLVAVAAASRSWRDAAMEILALGLLRLGLGAKTNAGYGRFTLEGR